MLPFTLVQPTPFSPCLHLQLMPCQSTLRGSPPFWRARAFGEPALFCLPTPVGADSGSPSIRSHTLCRSLPSLAPHSSFFSLGALTLSRSLSLLTLPLLYDFASRRVRFNPPFSFVDCRVPVSSITFLAFYTLCRRRPYVHLTRRLAPDAVSTSQLATSARMRAGTARPAAM